MESPAGYLLTYCLVAIGCAAVSWLLKRVSQTTPRCHPNSKGPRGHIAEKERTEFDGGKHINRGESPSSILARHEHTYMR